MSDKIVETESMLRDHWYSTLIGRPETLLSELTVEMTEIVVKQLELDYESARQFVGKWFKEEDVI